MDININGFQWIPLTETHHCLISFPDLQVDRKNEIEAHEVLRKVRLGYHRINLPAVS